MTDSSPLVIIGSGRLVDSQLAAEVGPLPPALLPAGQRRLIDRQVELFSDSRVAVTLPSDYELSAADKRWIASHGIEIVRITEEELGRSILQALRESKPPEDVWVLHGDTLFLDWSPPAAGDWISIDEPSHDIPWGWFAEDRMPGDRIRAGARPGPEWKALTGFFAFVDATLLMHALEHGRDYLSALSIYDRARPFQCCSPGLWLDFGHVASFQLARTQLLSGRYFNEVRVDAGRFRKTGSDPAKLARELSWYRALPEALRLHVPQHLGLVPDGEGYQLEFLPHCTIAELFVFSRLSAAEWERIGFEMLRVLRDFASVRPDDPEAIVARVNANLVIGKTMRRLEAFCQARDVSMTKDWIVNGRPAPSLERIAEDVLSHASMHGAQHAAVMHGDFCFSNLSIDLRTKRLRCFDPRGSLDDAAPELFGSSIYDLAKLLHSAVGNYDSILVEHYSLSGGGQRLDLEIEKPGAATPLCHFLAKAPELASPDTRQVALATMVSLFLSMLPLHADAPRRQMALLANAMALYLELPDLLA